MEFAIEFQSNCMDFNSYNYFMTKYNTEFDLTHKKHPKKVALKIAGRTFDLTFSKRRKKGKRLEMIYQYTHVEIKPLEKELNLKKDHKVLLEVDPSNMFKRKNLVEIYHKENPCLCTVNGNKTRMICAI